MTGEQVLHVMHVPGVHPFRDRLVERLREQANVCVHEDPNMRGVCYNHARALACMARNDTTNWSVLVQDDIVLLDGWEQELGLAAKYSPSKILGLAVHAQEGFSAYRRRVPYITGAFLLRANAIAYHQSVIRPLARFMALAAQMGYEYDDHAATTWGMLNDEPPARVTRSLVSHQDVKSLLGHSGGNKTQFTRIDNPATSWLRWDGHPRYVRRKEAHPTSVNLFLRKMERDIGWVPTNRDREAMARLGWDQ